MTASRLGRSRLLLGIVTLIVMLGFITIFLNTEEELQTTRQSRERCEQWQEAQALRIQAVTDQKFQLEKSLEAERKVQISIKEAYDLKIKEEKEAHKKVVLDLNLRFDTLQQHYKLLQSERNDLVEDFSKSKKAQLEELNDLSKKLKSLQSQLQLTIKQKENDVSVLKLQYKKLEEENHRYKENYGGSEKGHWLIQIKELREALDSCKSVCNKKSINEVANPAKLVKEINQNIKKSFSEQKRVSDNIYVIPIFVQNNTELHENNTTNTIGGEIFKNMSKIEKNYAINSVETFQIIPKPFTSNENQSKGNEEKKGVLQQPPPLNYRTSTSDTKIEDIQNQASIATKASERLNKNSSTVANNRSQETFGRNKLNNIPSGVAPPPENFDDDIIKKEEIHNDNRNNNYANIFDDISGKKDIIEKDNVGHEDIEEKHDQLQDLLENVNNAAEDINNIDETNIKIKYNKKHDELEGNKHNHHEDFKLLNDEDQGREQEADDIGENEEDEDDDEYSEHLRHEGQK